MSLREGDGSRFTFAWHQRHPDVALLNRKWEADDVNEQVRRSQDNCEASPPQTRIGQQMRTTDDRGCAR
jgi:hypothetical protein